MNYMKNITGSVMFLGVRPDTQLLNQSIKNILHVLQMTQWIFAIQNLITVNLTYFL